MEVEMVLARSPTARRGSAAIWASANHSANRPAAAGPNPTRPELRGATINKSI